MTGVLRSPRLRFVRRLPASLALVTCLAACGAHRHAAPTRPIRDVPPGQVVATTLAAGAAADSAHLVGDATGLGGNAVHYDVRVGQHEGYGRFTINGAALDARRIGSKIYIRGSRRFWRGIFQHGPPFAISSWTEASATNPVIHGLVPFLELPSALATVLPTGTRMFEEGPGVRDGRPALEFTGDHADLYVARGGPPYPLSYADSEGLQGGVAFTFAGWNEPLHVTAPKARYTLDG